MLLYIHIPFCDSKCFYCAFNSYTKKSSLKDKYIKKLIKEFKYLVSKYKIKKESFDTLYIGGGTPSCLDAKLYEELFFYLNPYLKKGIEKTCEANPNSANFAWQNNMKKLGITRLSFGVQSFDDTKLKILGRNHNKKTALKALEDAQTLGFESVSCDIIYGLKNDNIKMLKKDLEFIQSLEIKHLSAYSLIIEEGTKFEKKSYLKIDDEILSKDFFNHLESLGFIQYEISAFAKEKKYFSKHNIGYWDYKPYLGLGCGAVGRIGDTRYYCEKNLEKYLGENLEEGLEKKSEKDFYYDFETLSKEDIKTEKMLLGLRSFVGFELDILNKDEQAKVLFLLKENKLFQKGSKIFAKDFLLCDELALYILD